MSTYYTENGHLVSDETIRTLQSILPKLGEGVSRAVYDLSDNEVLKVDIGSNWAGTNRTECEFWDNLDKEDERHFAAIIAHSDSYRWIVAEKVHTVANDAYGSNANILDEWRRSNLYELQSKYNFEDMHDGNYGIRTNGTCAVVDYAMNSSRYNSDNWITWCSECETNKSHRASHHGSFCAHCNERHNTGQTDRHGAECDKCDSRQEDHRTFRTFECETSHRFRNGAKVTKRTIRRLCSWCANTDNRHIVVDNVKIRKIVHTVRKSDKKEIPGQQRFTFKRDVAAITGCRCGCNNAYPVILAY